MIRILVALVLAIGIVAAGETRVVSPWKTAGIGGKGSTAGKGSPPGKPHPSDILSREQLEAELILDSLPFRFPVRLDKKQKVAAVKLMKIVAKPLLRSDELKAVVVYFDDLAYAWKEDVTTRMYATVILDIVQDLYTDKNQSALHQLIYEIVNDIGSDDQVTARTIDQLWSNWSPSINRWVVSPVRNLIIDPFNNYVSTPISTFATRVSRIVGGDYNELDDQEGYSQRWAETLNNLIDRTSKYTNQARNGLDTARNFLDIQDYANEVQQARCTGGSCGHGASPTSDALFE